MTNLGEQHIFIPSDVSVDPESGRLALVNWANAYRINDRQKKFMLSFPGMGMPGIAYIEEQGPLQHGRTILKYRLKERYVQYVVRINANCSRDNYWEDRGKLMNWLRPNRQFSSNLFYELGRLRVVWPNGTVRDIDAVIQSGPRFRARRPNQWDEWAFTETLRFKCPDPTFYDPTRQDVVWTTRVYRGWSFYSPNNPEHLVFPDNAVFGSGALAGTTSITYTGTWIAYPIIQIVGPLAGPSITSTTINKTIRLNYSISAGETVTIDTTYGRKTIVNNANTNLIGTLTDDSDLDFFIAMDPYAAGGVNSFVVGGAGAVEGETELRMSYYTRYIGI